MDKMITQQELSEKYYVDQGTVSVALSSAGVFKKDLLVNGRSRKKQYSEKEAVAALVKLFKKRAAQYESMALDWKNKAYLIEMALEDDEQEEGEQDGTIEHGE